MYSKWIFPAPKTDIHFRAACLSVGKLQNVTRFPFPRLQLSVCVD